MTSLGKWFSHLGDSVAGNGSLVAKMQSKNMAFTATFHTQR